MLTSEANTRFSQDEEMICSKTQFSDFSCLDAFFADVNFYSERLSHPEEKALFADLENSEKAKKELESHAGDEAAVHALQAQIRKGTAARNRLVYANLRLVIVIASKIQAPVPLEDRIQNGTIGLMKAIDRFDTSLDCRFSTYAAWWIRQAIIRSNIDEGSVIRIPVYMAEFIGKIQSAEKIYFDAHGKKPTPEQLMKLVGGSKEKVLLAMAFIRQKISMDHMAISETDDGDADMYNLVADEKTSSIEVDFEKKEMQQYTLNLFARSDLTEKETRVIKRRFGINCNHLFSLQEVGDELGISRERVRQIQITAIKKMKQRAHLDACSGKYF